MGYVSVSQITYLSLPAPEGGPVGAPTGRCGEGIVYLEKRAGNKQLQHRGMVHRQEVAGGFSLAAGATIRGLPPPKCVP
ncbi:hypothetical protein [Kamptonema formosum]|uniref:hypothetical protein n=1 Tax=Kamptonema formosum TaxID=331992 RepID=UPI000348AAAF|nr:hypothetical protein [Oscillatoria sp. PCC 10802]